VSQIRIDASYGPIVSGNKTYPTRRTPVKTRGAVLRRQGREPPSAPPVPPERGVKAATFGALLGAATDIIRDGHIPTVAEAATRARISRATAYRYFASRSALVTAVIETSLGPLRTLSSSNPDGRERVRELLQLTFPRFEEFEPQWRAGLQLSLEHWALERAGQLQEPPYRRGHRVRILAQALEPLAPALAPKSRERLHQALSVIYGIESYTVLRDIWGLDSRQAQAVAVWMADALIDAALREGAAPRRTAAAGPAVARRRRG
jgi:AcrR family transcriptional regulator